MNPAILLPSNSKTTFMPRRKTYDAFSDIIYVIHHYFTSISDVDIILSDVISYLPNTLPNTDIKEMDKDVTLTAELPRIYKNDNDIEISLLNNILTIKVKAKK